MSRGKESGYLETVLLRALFIAWIASLGADRIDLLGGAGPAMLVPFNALMAVLLAVVWGGHLRARRWPQLPRGAQSFAALLLLLVTLVALSVLRSADFGLSAGRAVLLLASCVGVPLIIWGVAEREDLLTLLGRGACAGLAFSAIMNLGQALNLIGLVPNDVFVGPVLLKFEVMRYGVFPRFAGAAFDMNRGAMLAVTFGVMVSLARPIVAGRRGWMLLASLMALSSLSRSAALAAIPVLLLTPQLQTSLRTVRSVRVVLGAALVAIALGASLMFNPDLRAQTSETLAPLASRLDVQEASAGVHAELYARAAEVSTRSYGEALGGIGYGMSFRELADVFGGNRYGNFHSSWLTLWVEVGIFALLVGWALILAPLRGVTAFRGLILGMFVFSIFYNFLGDPALWLCIALAWMTPRLWQEQRV